MEKSKVKIYINVICEAMKRALKPRRKMKAGRMLLMSLESV